MKQGRDLFINNPSLPNHTLNFNYFINPYFYQKYDYTTHCITAAYQKEFEFMFFAHEEPSRVSLLLFIVIISLILNQH